MELSDTLESMREKNWLDSRIAKVPGRDALRRLLDGRKMQGRFASQAEERQAKAIPLLGSMTARQRSELFESLFPRLAPHIERAWDDAAHTPYTVGWTTKPFRAPSSGPVVGKNRAHLVLQACDALHGLDLDAPALAAWSAHFEYVVDHDVLGRLVGAALNNGGPEADAVRDVLTAVIRGDHEIGVLRRDTIVALLNSTQRSDWEAVGALLLAAQRQEGLRQTVLEAADEANAGAFRYFLGLVLEHDLARFSATVRAFDVWLGFAWAGGSARVVNEGIERLCRYFDDDEARDLAIARGPAEDAYLALWVTAFRDAPEAIRAATPLLEDSDCERRFAAVTIIERTELYPEASAPLARRIISGKETDDRVTMALVRALGRAGKEAATDDLFAALARLFERIPARKRSLEAILWPWTTSELDRRVVASAIRSLGATSPDALLPYIPFLGGYECSDAIRELSGTQQYGGRPKKRPRLSADARALIIQLTGDARKDVHTAACEALDSLPVEEDEIEQHLSVLHRAAPTLRAGVIKRLTTLEAARLLELIPPLLSAKDAKRRAAGLELAAHLIEKDTSADLARALIAEHRAALTQPDLLEQADRLLADGAQAASLADCLGLVPEGSRRPLIVPRYTGHVLETDATKACLRSLGELLIKHGETEVELPRGEFGDEGATKALLANAGWRFPPPPKEGDVRENAQTRLPLAPVWIDWLQSRSGTLRDKDGFELIRAAAWLKRDETFRPILPAALRKDRAWEVERTLRQALKWIALLAEPVGAGAFMVQYAEDALAKDAPSPEEAKETKRVRGDWYEPSRAVKRLSACHDLARLRPSLFTPADRARLAALDLLALSRDESAADGPSVDEFAAAFDAGLANDRDLVWLLLYPRKSVDDTDREAMTPADCGFGPIDVVTGLRLHPALASRPVLAAAAGEVRGRLIELELTRGERPTPASFPCAQIRHAGGADVFFRLASALGRDTIVRQGQWGEPTRPYSLSRLISVTTPAPDDTPERFARLFGSSGLTPDRLVDLAMFAPQWAGHAESTLSIPGLEDVIWWIHAHTKGTAYWRDDGIRELWAAQINERTELDAEDLEEGAVDVAWFRRVIDTVGADGWDRLQKPAKYASNSGGHKRAQLFADAMLAKVTPADLLRRIDGPRNQDALRALGLVPLPRDATKARAETLARYLRIQEFKRQSRQFGSQRQASEGRAVEIALDNLARTAGYRDPRRLQWSMESEAVADLARGPVAVTHGEVEVSLALSAEGEPELTVLKKGKTLKNVPSTLSKHTGISELRARVTELRRQRSRMRHSLEQSMCRADVFTGPELAELFSHPMLRPVLERVVLIGEGGLIGYPQDGGRVLRHHAGGLEPVGTKDTLRIAHPLDLLARGDWPDWQRECFAAERIQPFKQLFREVYPKTGAELTTDLTRRYAGHQVNPRQALALLKQRQWVHSPERGVRRVYHDQRLIAEVWFQEHFYTPAEVDGLTLEGVAFLQRGKDATRLAMSNVPDLVFSEAMRDLDLVVSVAHAGGVDPEASASTVEMRAALLRETCQLLGLANVRVDGHHAIIDGTRASYSVHLGSATTRVLPGRVLVIVAVHSQYRGRLFLPFADDDPRTAEVLAKALLLARDDEIKDPSILAQIR